MCDLKTSLKCLSGLGNWTKWKRQLELYLKHQDVWGYVSKKSEEKPDPKKESLALLLILTHVDDKHADLIASCTNARQAWAKLCTLYDSSNAQRLDCLLESFFNFRPEGDIVEIVTSLQNLFIEINRELSEVGNKQQLPELVLLSRIISILPQEYFEFKTVWESIPAKDRNIDLLTERLRLLETRLKGMNHSTVENGKALAVTCWGCNKQGHIRSKCPEKIKKDRKKPLRRKQLQNYNKNENTSCSFFCNDDEDLAGQVAQKGEYSVAKPSHLWLVDSGSSYHMTGLRSVFDKLEDFDGPVVKMANGAASKAIGRGNVVLVTNPSSNHCNVKTVTLKNVILVPDLNVNLISVSQIASNNMSITFNKNSAIIRTICNGRYGDIKATATRKGNTYVLDGKTKFGKSISNSINDKNISSANVGQVSCLQNVSGCSDSQMLWHKRLGHLGIANMRRIKNLVQGIKFADGNFNKCPECIKGKMVRLSHPKVSDTRATRRNQLIVSDLCGPFVPSHNGARYVLGFTDDYSRETFVYFLKNKNETFQKFQEFRAMVENYTQEKICTLRTDGGGEYVSKQWIEYMKTNGIRHELSAPYCPYQNGISERLWLTLLQKTRCLLIESGLGQEYWAECLNTCVYLKNRCPTVAVKNAVPHELWTGNKVAVNHLKVFGCAAYAHVKGHVGKLEPRAKKYVFVGYCDNMKAYRLIDLDDPTKVVKSRDVSFIENEYPGLNTRSKDSPLTFLPGLQLIGTQPLVEESLPTTEQPSVAESPAISPSSPKTVVTSDDISPNRTINVTNIPDLSMYEPSDETILGAEKVTTARSNYHLRPRDKGSNNTDLNQTIREDDSDEEEDASYVSAFTVSDCDVENLTVSEALKDHNWGTAMAQEMDAMHKNHVWDLVDLPKGRKAIKCRWVFKCKRDNNGAVQRYKARLVAKGYSQKYLVDFDNTYAPVVKLATVRLLLAMAAHQNLEVHHLDVDSAFLYADLPNELYMNQPEGFVVKGKEGKVVKLRKCIYGLRQSSREWNNTLKRVLLQMGYIQCKAEPCLFYISKGDSFSAILCFVDDLLVIDGSKVRLEQVKQYLKSEFSMKDLGPVTSLLGMKIYRDSGGIKIDQERYINDVLDRFQMLDCNTVDTPMEPGIKLEAPTQNEIIQNVPYQHLMGCLTYLAVTSRPDISNCVSRLAQFNGSHGEIHWKAAKRILRYLKGTRNYSLFYPSSDKSSKLQLVAYCDADYSSNLLDRKSFTGYIVKLGEGLISWESKKQTTVAASTAEAEYMALSDTTKEIRFLTFILNEVNGFIAEPVTIYSDSQSAISLVKNEMVNRRTKHIDVRHHFIREAAANGLIDIVHLAGSAMIADIMTKPLPAIKFNFCIEGLFK